MADIQAAAGMIDIAVKVVTIALLIIAASISIKNKANLCLGVLIVGNLLVYYLTQSPLLCMILSVICIIWAGMTKNKEQAESTENKSAKQTSGSKHSKAGNVIGLILGIGFVAGPLIAYFGQEASLRDPTTQGILILFAVIGGFMIINNLFKLFERESASVTQVKTTSKKAKEEVEKEEKEEKMIRCRFCKKKYSAEFNGCPYCKKK